MELLTFGNLIANGFQFAFEKFQQQQENRLMALTAEISAKVQQVLENQNVSSQLAIQAIEAVAQETSEVGDAVLVLTTSNAQLIQTNADKDTLIAQLLQQLEAANQAGLETEQLKADFESALDAINQQQQEEIAKQQEAIAKISNIFVSETPNPETPPVDPEQPV